MLRKEQALVPGAAPGRERRWMGPGAASGLGAGDGLSDIWASAGTSQRMGQ